MLLVHYIRLPRVCSSWGGGGLSKENSVERAAKSFSPRRSFKCAAGAPIFPEMGLVARSNGNQSNLFYAAAPQKCRQALIL